MSHNPIRNIYEYLDEIEFSKQIKEQSELLRIKRDSADFEAITSEFCLSNFAFKLIREVVEKIYNDVEKADVNKSKRNKITARA